MSLQFMHEFKKHATPEAFILNFLIPAINEGELPSRNLTTEGLNHESTLVSEIFVKHNDYTLPIIIDRTRPSMQAAASGRISSDPHLSVGFFSRIAVDLDDYLNAVDAFGKVVHQHPGKGASESHTVNLPSGIASHWGKSARVIKRNGRYTLVVKVDRNTFEKLREAIRLDKFARRYIDVLKFHKGEPGFTRDMLAAHLAIPPDESNQRDPIAAFFEAHAPEFDLIKRLSAASSTDIIRAILQSKFNQSKRLDHYAQVISRELRHGHGFHAAQRLYIAGEMARRMKVGAK